MPKADYQSLVSLAEGSFGEFFKAKRVSDGLEVCLKKSLLVILPKFPERKLKLKLSFYIILTTHLLSNI
jgi:hypothetical protein